MTDRIFICIRISIHSRDEIPFVKKLIWCERAALLMVTFGIGSIGIITLREIMVYTQQEEEKKIIHIL